MHAQFFDVYDTRYRAVWEYLPKAVCHEHHISEGGFFFGFGVGDDPVTGYFWLFNSRVSIDYIREKLNLPGTHRWHYGAAIVAWIVEQALAGQARPDPSDDNFGFYLHGMENEQRGCMSFAERTLVHADPWLEVFETEGGRNWMRLRTDLFGTPDEAGARSNPLIPPPAYINEFMSGVFEREQREREKRWARDEMGASLADEHGAPPSGEGKPASDFLLDAYQQSRADQEYVNQLRAQGDPVEQDQVRAPIYPVSTDCPECGAPWGGPHAPGCPAISE